MKNKNKLLNSLKGMQKNILSKVNEITSNKEVQKTFKTAQDYGQKVAHTVIKELQKQGKITANEAKKVLQEVNKRSHTEKSKLYKNLKKDSEGLLNSMKNVIINSLALAKKYTSLEEEPVHKKRLEK